MDLFAGRVPDRLEAARAWGAAATPAERAWALDLLTAGRACLALELADADEACCPDNPEWASTVEGLREGALIQHDLIIVLDAAGVLPRDYQPREMVWVRDWHRGCPYAIPGSWDFLDAVLTPQRG